MVVFADATVNSIFDPLKCTNQHGQAFAVCMNKHIAFMVVYER